MVEFEKLEVTDLPTDFRLDPCPGCKDEERGFFFSMEEKKGRKEVKELLKTKNITISVPKNGQ